MTDVFSADKRSDVMSRIRSKNTTPEMRLRRVLHALGYRYRLHVNGLPGKPDLVLPRYRTVIQVRGCFWHGHTCIDGHHPKSRPEYWVKKLTGNQQRDRENDERLRALGWQVLVVWECECSSGTRLHNTVLRVVQALVDDCPR